MVISVKKNEKGVLKDACKDRTNASNCIRLKIITITLRADTLLWDVRPKKSNVMADILLGDQDTPHPYSVSTAANEDHHSHNNKQKTLIPTATSG
ncbi:MAG: hypothetical protein C4527_02770 [Candidatus Omnitrophota bacterium]|jgi:hypothetical protein|nr:MAG: hypothetical protein C4527_02770 [Candidatus Omnitrophota bacterium]